MRVTKGDDTKSSVLSAALDLASEEGLVGVTIGRLADKVGMSKSGLFAHFASKEKLQIDILEEAKARFVAHVVSPALKARRGEPRVIALFDRWLAWKDVLPGGCVFAAAAVELDDKPGPARDVLVGTQKDWLETLATAIRIAVDEGHFRRDVDVEQLAHEIYLLGYGHLFTSRLLKNDKGEARTRAAFARILASARRPS